MKLIIEMPDEAYNKLIKEQHLPSGLDVEYFIIHGTPLPKGHGDLIDTEKLKNAFIAWSIVVHGNFTDTDIASIICHSPTIIEADKGE